MWPWEHVAVAYVCYSLYRRLLPMDRPGGSDTLVLVLGTQLPDLVDKSLAWLVGVLGSGTAIAHSLLFAVPLCLVVLALARVLGVTRHGVAFAVGYLTHLLGDVLYPLFTESELGYRLLFWPLFGVDGGTDTGVLENLAPLLYEFRVFLGTPRGRLYLLLELAFLAATFVLWLADGAPGLPTETDDYGRRGEMGGDR